MKESLERIGAWVKAHPWAAVGIVVALVVVGFLVYKATQSGGGSLASQTPTDESGGVSGGMGGGDIPLPEQPGEVPLPTPSYSITPDGSGYVPTYDYGASYTSTPAVPVVLSKSDPTSGGGSSGGGGTVPPSKNAPVPSEPLPGPKGDDTSTHRKIPGPPAPLPPKTDPRPTNPKSATVQYLPVANVTPRAPAPTRAA